MTLFLSTLPVRGATRCSRSVVVLVIISIHASLAGSDYLSVLVLLADFPNGISSEHYIVRSNGRQACRSMLRFYASSTSRSLAAHVQSPDILSPAMSSE